MKIGFIGLEIMGKPMRKNLLKAGYALVVLDRNNESVEEMVAAGAERATSPKAVAKQCEVIITMLSNSPHVKEVVLGENGVIEGAKASSVVINMSSIAPLASREIAAALAEKNIQMLDEPVSGGDKSIFERHVDMLKSMASSGGAYRRHWCRQCYQIGESGDRGAEYRCHVRSDGACH